jgi:hypothetical protein
MKRAMILGQAAPGVPIWRCDEATSRHSGVPYIVFPGNVGGDDTLAELVERWALSGLTSDDPRLAERSNVRSAARNIIAP